LIGFIKDFLVSLKRRNCWATSQATTWTYFPLKKTRKPLKLSRLYRNFNKRLNCSSLLTKKPPNIFNSTPISSPETCLLFIEARMHWQNSIWSFRTTLTLKVIPNGFTLLFRI